MNKELKEWEQEIFTDEEINEIAEWFEDLTMAQLSFLKGSYTAMISLQCAELDQAYVH